MSAEKPNDSDRPDPAGRSPRERRLSEYAAGDLSRAAAGRVARSLRDDPDAQEQVRRYEALEGLLEELGQDLPAELELDETHQRGEILRALERRQLLDGARRASPGRTLRLWAPLAAAAAVLLAAGAFLLWQRGAESPRPEGPSGVAAVESRLVTPSGRSAEKSAEAVRARVLTAARPAADAGPVVLTVRRREQDAFARTPEPGSDELPAGTIVFSFSPEDARESAGPWEVLLQ